MRTRLSATEIAEALRKAFQKGLLRPEDTLAIFYDLAFLEERIHILQESFPRHTIHGVATKTNPIYKILIKLREMGAGAEVASFGELKMAESAGYSPSVIVYDSPVKTVDELEYAIKKGIHINIDSLAELSRIAEIKKSVTSAGTSGIRINPQVGTGSIAESSVAGEYSKFGVPIKFRRDELLKAFDQNPWLNGVHLHVGSQGCAPQMLIDGIGILYDLVTEVNSKHPGQINFFDIGGGLPVAYLHDHKPLSMEEYTGKLKKAFPALFTNAFTLITEFGRWVHVNSGWTLSRIEYVKNDGGIRTAMIHAGADLFLRECLNPVDWKHEYSVTDPNGNLKDGKLSPCHLAGPLCFSGDMLAKDVMLPGIEEGDFLIVHDSGGYTFSMWSRYNSRFTPRIIGYRDNDFEILKERETEEEMMNFWK